MAIFDFFDEPTRSRPKCTPREKKALFREQGGICNGCRKKFVIGNLTVDHKNKPFSQGGSDRFDNLQLLCMNCNRLKSDGTMAQLRRKLRQQGIIKPAAKSKTRKAKPKSRTTRRQNDDPFGFLFGGGDDFWKL